MIQMKYYKDANIDEWLSMVGSQAKGLPLVKSGNFAADMLKFDRWEQTTLHTHPGNHILFVVEGDGWLDYGDKTYDLTSGSCYFVEGHIPHRVRASSVGMFLLAIANNHYSVDNPDRLEVIRE